MRPRCSEWISQADEKGRCEHILLCRFTQKQKKQVHNLHVATLQCTPWQNKSLSIQVRYPNTGQPFQEIHASIQWRQKERCGGIIITIIMIAHSRGKTKHCCNSNCRMLTAITDQVKKKKKKQPLQISFRATFFLLVLVVSVSIPSDIVWKG